MGVMGAQPGACEDGKEDVDGNKGAEGSAEGVKPGAPTPYTRTLEFRTQRAGYFRPVKKGGHVQSHYCQGSEQRMMSMYA